MLDIGAAKLGLMALLTAGIYTQGDIVSPTAWLQYGALGVLALYIVLHWMERKDQRRRMEPVLIELNGTLQGLVVLMDERLPREFSAK